MNGTARRSQAAHAQQREPSSRIHWEWREDSSLWSCSETKGWRDVDVGSPRQDAERVAAVAGEDDSFGCNPPSIVKADASGDASGRAAFDRYKLTAWLRCR